MQRLVSACCVSEMSGEVWVSLNTKEQAQRTAAVSAQRLQYPGVMSQKRSGTVNGTKVKYPNNAPHICVRAWKSSQIMLRPNFSKQPIRTKKCFFGPLFIYF